MSEGVLTRPAHARLFSGAKSALLLGAKKKRGELFADDLVPVAQRHALLLR